MIRWHDLESQQCLMRARNRPTPLRQNRGIEALEVRLAPEMVQRAKDKACSLHMELDEFLIELIEVGLVS